ncbi:MAG: TolB family protein, partial [Gammaproteobacteria bacterium]
MKHAICWLALATLAAAGPAVAAPPASSETARIDAILAQRANVKEIRSVTLSSDGEHLAWLVTHKDESTLTLSAGNGRNAHTVSIPGGCKPEGLDWAPKSDTLAVLTRCKVNPTNTKPINGAIWLLHADTGAKPLKLVDLNGYASDLHWTPDGERLAFLYVPGATRLAQATASSNPRVGVIGENDARPERVATLTVSSGKLRVLTPASLYVYEFDFSPDGKRIAYTAAPPPGDDNW